MGLRKPAETVEASAPAFESAESPSTVVDTAAEAANAPVVDKTVVDHIAEKPVVQAPALVKPTAVSTSASKKYAPALQEFKDQIDPSTLDFDTFKRITVGLAGFNDEAKNKLGTRIKIEVMSYNDRFVVSPGVKNAEADEKVRYSLDGINLDDGSGSAQDYLKTLKEVDGYAEASIKRYLNIYGFLVATAKSEDAPFVEIAAEDREIVTVQIPPRSYGKFTGYQLNTGVKVAQGIMQPSNTLVMASKAVSGKSVEYAEIAFSRG